MKKLLLAIFSLISIISYSQTTGYLRYDTVKIMKQGGNSNLIIENATRDSLGFLYNYGGGRTRFEVIRAVPGGIKVGEDTIIVGSDLSDRLLSGGEVTYSGTGLKFYISPAVYIIDEVIYTTAQDSVTLSASDPTNPRKDVIYLATTGVEVAEGVPAGPAAEPQLEGGQIKLTVIDIPAAATTPGITITTIYDENTAPEWVPITQTGTTIDADQTAVVFKGAKALNVTNISTDDRIFATNGSTVNLSSSHAISGFIKLKAAMSGAANLRLRFFNGATVVSTEVTIAINKNSTEWQAFSVPINNFTFNGNYFADRVQIRYTYSTSTVHTGFYLDYLHFETGIIQPNSGSTTPLAVGTIDGKPANPNGLTIADGYVYQQTGTQTNPGLISTADKTKLDSLHSDYFITPLGDGEPLALQVNDSTIGIKSLKIINGVLTPTDSTLTIDLSGITGGVDESKVGADFVITNDSLKNAGFVNILDFGAVGDGVTNNTTAIQNAVNTGKPVYVPPGTFLVSTIVNLGVNQTIFGHDWTSIIKITANTAAIKVDTGSRVTGIKFVGNGKAGSGTFNTGVYCNDAIGWSIDNCMLTEFSGNPVLNGGGGVFASGVSLSNSDGGRITNNYFYNNDCGLNIGTRGEYVTSTANTFGSNTVAILAAGGNQTINNNIIQNNTTGIKSILATNGAHSTFNGNLLNHNIYPLWLEDAPFQTGFNINGGFIVGGSIKFIRANNIQFSNVHAYSLDSVHLDSSKNLTRIGGFWGLSSSSGPTAINRYNGAEEFNDVGVTREAPDSLGNILKQYLKGTVALSDSAQIAGRFILLGNRPASASGSDSVLVWNTTTKEVLVRAQSDIGGGGISDGDKGDITVSGSGSTWTVDNSAITFAKIQDLTQARLLGRYTASTGVAQEISIGSGLALDAGTGVLSATGGGSGDVVGPASATDGVPALFDGTTGKLIKNSTPTGTGNPVMQTSPTVNTKLTLTGATETTSNPVFDATQTWNASGTTFDFLKGNVTSTASAAASKLMNLQVGGVSQITVDKVGGVNLPTTGTYMIDTDYGMSYFSTRLAFQRDGIGQMMLDGTNMVVANTVGIGWLAGGISATSADTKLNRDGTAGIIAQKNSTTAQEFRIYNTDVAADDEFASLGFKNSTNVFQIATEKLASGVERDLELVSGAGNTRVTKLAGTGTRNVVADASGNLSTQAKITLTKNAMVENPTASENLFMFRTPVAITVTDVTAVLVGGTPSVTYNIAFGTDRTSATNVYTAGQTVTSETTGTAASGVNDATIPAGSWVWITTSAATDVTQLNISLTYTED